MGYNLNCQPVRFSTPKKFQLDGLWFFVPKSRQAIVFIHGLGDSMFWPNLVYRLANDKTSVLAFNNRGHDKISNVRHLDKNGKMHKLLPPEIWPNLHDAQRFLSLFTPESKEEIFCYATPSRRPAALQKTSVPILLIFAEKDEHLDRPLIEIIKWFEENLINKNVSIKTI